MTRPIITRTRAEVYRLWIDALRSGKYRQAQYRLKSDEGYCCLGVLCDLARVDGGPGWSDGLYRVIDGQLPHQMARFMGLTQRAQNRLADLNDKSCTPFPQIADYIEQRIMPKALARP